LERQVARESAHKAALKKLKLRGRLLELVSIARKNSHLRTHRVEVYVRTFHQASSLIEAVAVKLGLNRKDTLYLSFDEMEAMLSRKLSPDSIDLRERKMGMAYIMKNRQVQTFFGEAAKRMAMPDEEEASKTSPVVRGTAANLGKARGVVRVVHDISELHKVRQGDILVASMTIPEFAPAMEKAAAFVTDEGGITCHAAIISREMGVPCLIGTRNGTKILRDGERVEVDAFRAVVRRLASSTSG
jgi:phosphohistidine swiveling domain-containing protein